MESAVTIEHLVKTYGTRRAVDDLSLSVPKGSIFGILGPNGAGKTTTLECAEGLRKADGGKISILGIDPVTKKHQLYRNIGVQLQTSGIPGTMNSLDALNFFARYHGIKPSRIMLERLGLGNHLKVPYGAMSVGQKRRLTLAIAAAHAPQVLFLDEPTAGLDVESRIELHKIIREFREEGRTVVLATHDMAEAESLCDNLAIIIRGKLAVTGTPSQVTAAGDKRTRITVSTEKSSICTNRPELPNASLESVKDGYACYTTEDPQVSLTALLSCIEKNKDVLTDLRVQRPSLEQRFMEITSRKEDAA